MFVASVALVLLVLAMVGLVYNTVYVIRKLVNHEMDVDAVEFTQCIKPYMYLEQIVKMIYSENILSCGTKLNINICKILMKT